MANVFIKRGIFEQFLRRHILFQYSEYEDGRRSEENIEESEQIAVEQSLSAEGTVELVKYLAVHESHVLYTNKVTFS